MREKKSGRYGIPEPKRTVEEQAEIDRHPCKGCVHATFLPGKVYCPFPSKTPETCEYARRKNAENNDSRD